MLQRKSSVCTRIKKIVFVFILTFSMGVLALQPEGKVILKISVPSKEGSSNVRIIENFERELQKQSPGTFKVEKLLLEKGALPQGTEYNAMKAGEINMTFLSPSDLYNVIEAHEKELSFSVIEKEMFENAVLIQMMPFLIQNQSHMEAALKILNTFIAPGMDVLGIVSLGTFYHGCRIVSTALSSFITKPEQIKKLRMPEGKLWKMVAYSLGSLSFIKVARGEVEEAVKRGEIKSMDIPLVSFEESGFFGFFPKVVETNHLYHYLYFVITKNTWKKMTKEQRKILMIAAEEAIRINNVERIEKEKILLQDYKKQKIVVSHSDLDLKAFQDHTKKVFAEKLKGLSFKTLYETIKML